MTISGNIRSKTGCEASSDISPSSRPGGPLLTAEESAQTELCIAEIGCGSSASGKGRETTEEQPKGPRTILVVTEACTTRRNSSDALTHTCSCERNAWPFALCLSHTILVENLLASDLIGLVISQISFTQLILELKKEQDASCLLNQFDCIS